MVRLLPRYVGRSTFIEIRRDTVSSVGFGRGDVCLSASSAAAHACHIRHALALDECRVKFMPEYSFEMNSPDLQNSVGDGQPKSCGAETSNENGSRRPDEPEMVTYTMNATTSAGDFRDSGFVDVAFDEWDKLSATTPRAQRNAIPCAQSSCDGHTDQRAADIKEVWFAGSHSDVYVHVDFAVSCHPCSSSLQGWDASPGKGIPCRKCFSYVDAAGGVYEWTELEARRHSLDCRRPQLWNDQFDDSLLETGRNFSS